LTAMDLAFLGDIGYTALVLPVPVTGSVDVVSNVEAFIQGSAILKGATTTVSLEYGFDTSYGLTKSFLLPNSIPNFNVATPVSLVLTGLEPGMTYHYRVKATSPEGSATGSDATFTLPAASLGATIVCDNQVVTFSPLTVNAVPGSPSAGVTLLVPGNSVSQKVGAVTQGAFGTVAINGANVVYTPGASYFGEDAFSYTITAITPSDIPGVKPLTGPFKATVQVRSSTASTPHAAAIKGNAIPGALSGTVYGTLGTPAAGPFAGTQQGSGGTVRAIFTSNGDVRFKVNDSPAGLGGMKLAKFGDPSGHSVAANLKIASPTVTAKNDGILIAGLENGVLRIAAREGVPLPGLPAGVTIKTFGSIDGNGPVTFFAATLQGTGITSKNDGALCVALTDGSVRILAQEGQLVDGKSVAVLGSLVGLPGTLADGRWLAGSDEQPALGVRVTFSDKSQAIYMMPASGAAWIKLVETNGDLGLGSLGLPGFGPDGAAFTANFKAGTPNVTASNDTALFFSQGGVTTVLAREADLAPGSDGVAIPDTRFKTLSDPVAGAGRRGAFTGTVTGPNVKSTNSAGLWLFAPGTKGVRLLARAGDPAPGGGKWATFPSVVMSDAPDGGVIFLATRAVESGSPLTAKKNMGLWAVDNAGLPQPLVQTGQMMQISGSNKKVTALVALKAAAGSIGAAQGYDSEGHVAVLVTFEDRTVALIIAVAP
ncbi:MAG: cell wall-binding protein, partial [Chthoniobacteraceae bacterium]|nr:cell wall-binding protein [Chthoniobacteraceae bacterium]